MKTNISNKAKGLAKAVLPFCLFTLLPFATACSPEEYEGANEAGIPSVAGQDFSMTVDQETNQVLVSYPEKPGVYPVWSFNGATYSTLNNAGWQNNKKGIYTVSLRLGNRNGFSQGEVTKEFTFYETKASFTTELNRLSKAEWRIDHAEVAHLACGPYGGDGSGWWSAAPNEKKDFGVYDDRISFESDGLMGGTFTYDPGKDGMTYININSTIFDNGGATADFDTPTQPQTSTFELKKDDWIDAEGNLIETNFLLLGENTLFPYISHDRQYEAPRFRIETLTASKLVLVYENEPDAISWRFIFTNKEDTQDIDPNDPANVKWVDVDSPENLGRDFNTVGKMNFWWADAGWSQIGDPQFTYADGVYTIVANDATSAEWQAQNSIQHVAMNIEAGQAYDISVKLVANQALGRFTFKVCDQNDDDNTLIYNGGLSLDAGENLVQFANVKAKKNGADSGFSEAKLFIDLGGCPAGMEVKLSDIIIQKHEGSSGGGGGFNWVDVNAAENLGAGFNAVGKMEFWWADASWSQIGDPGFAFENGVYIITATENGGAEWQAQNSIHHVPMNIEPGQLYAVRATIEASQAVGRYTFKICDENDDDNTLVYNGSLSLEAGENIVELKGVKAQKGGADSGFSEAKLFIDLGGITPGTEIRLSDIIVQKYEESAPTPVDDDTPLSYDDAANMWKSVDDGSMFDKWDTWFADNSWVALPTQPEITQTDDCYELTIPEGMGNSQWQGQFHIDTKLTASADKKYDFQVTMETTADCPGVTFKLTDAGDTNFFIEERQNVPGNEEFVFTRKGVTLKEGKDATAIRMFFDFGGSPAGTHVVISKIVLKEAQ